MSQLVSRMILYAVARLLIPSVVVNVLIKCYNALLFTIFKYAVYCAKLNDDLMMARLLIPFNRPTAC